MAFHEFLAHVRAARSLMPPDVLAVGSAADPGHVRKALASADAWLRPAFAEPFDPATVRDPDPEVRDRLARDVDVIRALAARVDDDRPATPEERREGLDALLRIIPAVRPFALDPAAEQLVDHLWGRLETGFPELVLGFECDFGRDWSGDPAVNITCIIPDATDISDDAFRRFDDEANRAAREWARANGRADSWPYVTVREVGTVRDILIGAGE